MNADLLSNDSEKFLQGTGEVAEFESAVVDTYLSSEVRERMHFEFFNEEMWKFVNERYGCDQVIKRYYINNT